MTFKTQDSEIDVGHGINVWLGKFGKNKKAIGPRKNPKLVNVGPTFIRESRVSYLFYI